MAKTATGKNLPPFLFPFPHVILETVTKSATKAANNKTRAKAGEGWRIYARSFIVFPIHFLVSHLTHSDYTFLISS
jgi:hypothetical protein